MLLLCTGDVNVEQTSVSGNQIAALAEEVAIAAADNRATILLEQLPPILVSLGLCGESNLQMATKIENQG